MRIISIAAVFSLLLIFSYSRFGSVQKSDVTPRKNSKVSVLEIKKTPIVKKNFDPEQLKSGERRYSELCAMCHGADAQGGAQWKTPDAKGKFPPPPLNGYGHTWHHPMNVLRDYIKEGSIEKGGAMTGFKQVLSDEEVDNVIAWFQSKWPDELYSSWYWGDKKSQSK